MEIDRKTLKALGADTRMDILKSLKQRRKTSSELSKELKLAPSTILEHLGKLEGADLVKREETGHKWIYYNLTKKGTNLVKPRIPVPLVIVLGLVVILVFSFMFTPQFFGASSNLASRQTEIDESVPKMAVPEESITQNITDNTTENNSTIP